MHGATKLELAWTAFPVVVLFLIGAFVFIELPGIKDIPEATAGEEQLEIKVTGRQFYWQYEYPNGVIAIDHMRAPAGCPSVSRSRLPTRTSSTRGGSPRSAGRSTRSRAGRTTRGSRRTTRARTRDSARSSAASSMRGCSPGRGHVERRLLAWLDQRRSEQAPGRRSSATRSGRGVRQVPRHERRGRHRPAHRRLADTVRSSGARTSSATAAARCRRSARAGRTSRSQALATYLKESPPSGS